MTVVFTGLLFRGNASLFIDVSTVLKKVVAQHIGLGRHMWDIRAMSLVDVLKVICPST